MPNSQFSSIDRLVDLEKAFGTNYKNGFITTLHTVINTKEYVDKLSDIDKIIVDALFHPEMKYDDQDFHDNGYYDTVDSSIDFDRTKENSRKKKVSFNDSVDVGVIDDDDRSSQDDTNIQKPYNPYSLLCILSKYFINNSHDETISDLLHKINYQDYKQNRYAKKYV